MPAADDLEPLIAAHEVESERAWEAIRAAKADILPSTIALRAMLRRLNKPFAAYLAGQIEFFELDGEFKAALQAQGVIVDEDDQISIQDEIFPDEALSWFASGGRALRCQVRAGAGRGSGILVGPSTVLTAWHVVAVASPDKPQEPAARIEVEFADGRRFNAVLAAYSFCTPEEWHKKLPANDACMADRSDVALLRLAEPVGIHLGFARMSEDTKPFPGRRAIAVVQYPEGTYRGIGTGKLRKLRGLTGRWGHDAPTREGSSGGGCFDTQLALRGIHQGKAAHGVGRMVPVSRFPGSITEAILKDEVPDSVWSLDGSAGAPLVIGREQLFIAFHAAMRGAPRARGLWVRRTEPRDPSGLGFTYRLVENLVNRARDCRIVRISFDSLLKDHPNEVARRLRDAGFAVANPEAVSGAASDETEPEAVVADRSRRLAVAADAEAGRQNVRLWLYFDHPEVIFGDEPRWALTAFVDQALRLDNLRIAIAGYEGLQVVNTMFQQPFDAEGPGAPGLVVDYLGDFSRNDVVNALVRASTVLRGEPVSEDLAEYLADQALATLEAQTGGRYRPWQGGKIDEALRTTITQWAAEGGTEVADAPPANEP